MDKVNPSYGTPESGQDPSIEIGINDNIVKDLDHYIVGIKSNRKLNLFLITLLKIIPLTNSIFIYDLALLFTITKIFYFLSIPVCIKRMSVSSKEKNRFHRIMIFGNNLILVVVWYLSMKLGIIMSESQLRLVHIYCLLIPIFH